MSTGLGSANTISAWFSRICGQFFISIPTKCDLTSGCDLTSPFLNFEKQPSATIVRAPCNSFNVYTILDINGCQELAALTSALNVLSPVPTIQSVILQYTKSAIYAPLLNHENEL